MQVHVHICSYLFSEMTSLLRSPQNGSNGHKYEEMPICLLVISYYEKVGSATTKLKIKIDTKSER